MILFENLSGDCGASVFMGSFVLRGELFEGNFVNMKLN